MNFIWYFVNGSYGHWTFFFVSSTLFHSSAYNSWLHRSNVFETRMVFFSLHIHYTFVSAFLGCFVLPNWNGGRLRACNKSKLDVSRGCASSFPTKRVKYWQNRNHCSVNTRRIEYYLRAWLLSLLFVAHSTLCVCTKTIREIVSSIFFPYYLVPFYLVFWLLTCSPSSLLLPRV